MQRSFEVSVFRGDWEAIRKFDSLDSAREFAVWFAARWKVQARVIAVPGNEVVFDTAVEDEGQSTSGEG